MRGDCAIPSAKIRVHQGGLQRYPARKTFSFRYNIADFVSPARSTASPSIRSPHRQVVNHLFKATWDHTFRASNLLNEFGVAFNRPRLIRSAVAATSRSSSGLLRGCGTQHFRSCSGTGLVLESRPQHSLQFLDNLTWIKGTHSIRAGTDIRLAVTHDASDAQAFLGYAGEGLGGPRDLWPSRANLRSQPCLHSVATPRCTLQNVNYGFLRAGRLSRPPRLTLNLGLRYEYNTVLHGDQIGNFSIPTLIADPSNTVAPYAPVGAGLYKPDRNNFGPRFGFAWDLYGTGKSVLRGGFGVFYSPQLTGAALSLAGNHGVQGYNVNIFEDLGALCGTSFTIAYPLPYPLPVCSAAANVNSLDPNLRDTYSMHWSLGVQQQIVRNTILEISYVANRGVKLPGGAAYAGEEFNLSPFSLESPNQISPDFGKVRYLGRFRAIRTTSRLQASLRRHVAKGLNVDANYTWSHELDDAVNILTAAYQDSHNPMGDYANGDIDVRHNFTLGAV